MTQPAPKPAAPKKRKRTGEDSDGQFQKLVAKFLGGLQAGMLRATSEPATPEPVRNDVVRSLRPSQPQTGRYDQLGRLQAEMLRATPEPAATPEPVRNDLVRSLRPSAPSTGRYAILDRLQARSDDIRQRIKEFFARASPCDEMMHIDARYRDTLGTQSRAAPATAPLPFKITGPSFDL